MQLTLSDFDLQALAEQIAPLITTTQAEPDWVKLKDVRDDLFAGKSPAGSDCLSSTVSQPFRLKITRKGG